MIGGDVRAINERTKRAMAVHRRRLFWQRQFDAPISNACQANPQTIGRTLDYSSGGAGVTVCGCVSRRRVAHFK